MNYLDKQFTLRRPLQERKISLHNNKPIILSTSA